MLEGSDFLSVMNSAYMLEHPEIWKAARRRKLAELRSRTVIVLAIKPRYAKAIYEGRKNWEFRKAPPPLFQEMFVYESAPVSMITGTIMFSESVTGVPMAAMDIVRTNKCFTRNYPGISMADLEAYACKKLVTALRVYKAERFDTPVKLNPRPPQNWGRFILPPKPTAESEVSNDQS